MIFGIGNDIVEVARIQKAVDNHGDRFLHHVFTKQEVEYSFLRKKASIHLAARFAAKEAVAKAFGTGFSRGLSWQDIEVINDDLGKPQIHLSPFAKELFFPCDIHLSLSHTDSLASAFVVICTH